MSYPGWNRENRFVTRGDDERITAKGVSIQVLAVAGALVSVTIPNLRIIEEVIEITATYSPTMWPAREKLVTVSGNVVGVTVFNVTAGTTLTLDVIAIGV